MTPSSQARSWPEGKLREGASRRGAFSDVWMFGFTRAEWIGGLGREPG